MRKTVPDPRGMLPAIALLLSCALLACAAPVLAQAPDGFSEPAVYLSFDEGSGNFVLDNSGNGNAGTLFNVTRIDNGGCGRGLLFLNPDSYVSIPYRALNHPIRAITVSAWFYADNLTPAPLVSAYRDGGYRLGFDDGNDLWWTVSTESSGEVSVPVQNGNIAPHRWHQVTGTYDGSALKIYLDGVLRNQVNATGLIHYEYNNYIMLGADAGTSDQPFPCPRHFSGGLDEVRIYPVALSYSQVMDDRFRCQEGTHIPPVASAALLSFDPCRSVSGAVVLETNGTEDRVLSFPNRTVNGSWIVTIPPGSRLSVHAYDRYAKIYPDDWYIEIADEHGRQARTIAFANRNNAPAEAVIPSGNATVLLRYFDGRERFPATVTLRLESLPPLPPRLPEPVSILQNPIIVIYSASWATVVAILLVMIWLRWRKKAAMAGSGGSQDPANGKKQQ